MRPLCICAQSEQARLPLTVQSPQCLLRPLRHPPLPPVQLASGTIEVEHQHGHCRMERIGLAPFTAFGGSPQ